MLEDLLNLLTLQRDQTCLLQPHTANTILLRQVEAAIFPSSTLHQQQNQATSFACLLRLQERQRHKTAVRLSRYLTVIQTVTVK